MFFLLKSMVGNCHKNVRPMSSAPHELHWFMGGDFVSSLEGVR